MFLQLTIYLIGKAIKPFDCNRQNSMWLWSHIHNHRFIFSPCIQLGTLIEFIHKALDFIVDGAGFFPGINSHFKHRPKVFGHQPDVSERRVIKMVASSMASIFLTILTFHLEESRRTTDLDYRLLRVYFNLH